MLGPFSSAVEMLAALDARQVASRELVDLHIERIERLDPRLNAVIVRTFDRARASAADADRARANGDRAALLGLPLTLKESTQVAGLPQSAGIEALKDYRPAADGPIARAVFGAGACLLGTTNIPEALDDWQADSAVYGRTNNPWDLDRTPGGSTGGGAAALAAGLTPLEIGSDIGGSIRVPAAYCGLYGHRPSATAVPRRGGFPFGDRDHPAQVLSVQGPLARTAADLEFLFDVVAGPAEHEQVAWRLDLPPARHDRVDEFRVALMPELGLVQPSRAMHEALDDLTELLVGAGARVAEAMPALDHEQYMADYLRLLTVITSQGQSRDERQQTAKQFLDSGDTHLSAMAEGMLIDGEQLMALLDRRAVARDTWSQFFTEWDVLVCPTVLDVAYPHQTGDQSQRTLDVDGRPVPYLLNIVYPMWPIFTGQPATAFPAGLDPQGLPLGLQAIGPYLEDRTTIHFARLLEREWHRFQPPPDFAAS